jgi:hypothetical protein
MTLATLIAASVAALFTAVAAIAAWRAASTAAREARARSDPYVTMGVPRQDYERDALVIPLKNLGLGPARAVALQVKDLDGNVVSARIAPGLAPMESSDWVMFALAWPKLDPPTWQEVLVEGLCEDADGDRHPIFAFGGMPLPMPSADVSDVGSERLLEGADIDNRAFHLKQVGRATRDGTPLDAAKEWRTFWIISARRSHEGDEFVDWVRGEWAKLGMPDGQFLPPDWVDPALRSVDPEQEA